MLLKKTISFILFTAGLLFFTTCKKYPENTLWFKRYSKIPVINGYITEYRVNGIDSLNFLNVYYKPVIPNSHPPYNKTIRDIRQEKFEAYNRKSVYWGVNCDLYYSNMSYKWKSKGRAISIAGSVDTLYYRKQLFLNTKGEIEWDIQYLDKKGKKAKIKTTYNNNTYEITFENR